MEFPAELLAQIMSFCPDVRSMLRLASTSRRAHQVWQENAMAVACGVFALQPPEFLGFLEIAQIEDSMSGNATRPPIAEDEHLNASVCHFLQWMDGAATALQTLRVACLEDEVKRDPPINGEDVVRLTAAQHPATSQNGAPRRRRRRRR
jgi:hypothetical protein